MGRKKRPLTAERKEHLNRLKRASYLRKKAAKGPLTSDERAELAALPAPKMAHAKVEARAAANAPTLDEGPDQTDSDSPPGAPGAGADAAGSGPDASAPEPPERPDPDPPPAVEVLPRRGAGSGSTSGNWRDRYRVGGSSSGREATCREAAGLYCGILERLVRYIEESGARPILGRNEIAPDGPIFNATVLTADKLIPADFELTPEMELVCMSAVVTGQASAIAYRKRKADRGSGGKAGAPFPDPRRTPTPRGSDPAPEERAAPRPVSPDTISPEDPPPVPRALKTPLGDDIVH